MDTARYIVALLVWLSVPPAVMYWLMIHPFAERWRRVGVGRTFAVVGAVFLGIAAVLFILRDRVLVIEFGTHWVLWVTAGLCYAVAAMLEIACRKQLRFSTLAGVPELRADQSDRGVLSEGIYARVRHPRYVAFVFGILAMALFANYLASWIMVPVIVVALFIIAVLEERELIRSLGSEYQRYRDRVPMFVPRFGNRHRS